MVRLKDVAEDLGVSLSLVSKVLTGRMGKSAARPELVEAIHRRAKEMGYRKNISALALLNGRMHAIGIHLNGQGTPGTEITVHLLQGLTAEANRRGQRQHLNFFDSAEDFRKIQSSLQWGNVDGIVVGGHCKPELATILKDARKKGLPIVSVFNAPIQQDIPNVGMDNQETGRQATKHLISRGCRRIAHICDEMDRFEGYRIALREAGLRYSSALVLDPADGDDVQPCSVQRGRDAAHRLLKTDASFDAFFAPSDESAMGAMNVFADAGLRMPQDIKVIGVDNAPYCNLARPPLSSVDTRFGERGRVAVAMLMDLIDGKSVESIVLPPVVIARESSAG